MEEKNSYSKSLDELQKILTDLESENVEIDKLAESVKRATELIKMLRSKLKKTEVEIKEIVKEFDNTTQINADDTKCHSHESGNPV